MRSPYVKGQGGRAEGKEEYLSGYGSTNNLETVSRGMEKTHEEEWEAHTGQRSGRGKGEDRYRSEKWLMCTKKSEQQIIKMYLDPTLGLDRSTAPLAYTGSYLKPLKHQGQRSTHPRLISLLALKLWNNKLLIADTTSDSLSRFCCDLKLHLFFRLHLSLWHPNPS